jgi:cell division protein YceG involved in septum cleavage
MQRQQHRVRRSRVRVWGSRAFWYVMALAGTAIVLFLLLPNIIVWRHNPNAQPPFPVGVDPAKKTIEENPLAERIFNTEQTPLSAAAAQAGGWLVLLGQTIAQTNAYQTIAAVADLPQVVTINPGLRKEQVARLFAKPLAWDAATQKMFQQLPPVSNENLMEGTIPPGDYAVGSSASIIEVQTQVAERFQDTILSRYTPAIQKIVPLGQGLTIASILERETSDPEEMRIISGIIWNRLFQGMKLQMDSTLQYAKANGRTAVWWPQVLPRDKYIDSPYNTYQNQGLPPNPIAEPSVAAVLAALNPKKTDCLFYFHDDRGDFHCSETYEAHVAMLKKIYGQGR